MTAGRPQMYTPKQIQDIVSDLTLYIESHDDPTIVGFTSSYTKYSVNKDYISDHKEFSELRKRAIEKQEAYLLDGVTRNKLNATMGIFRLKQPQHGFSDKHEQEVTIKEVDISDEQAEQLIKARRNRTDS